MQVKVAVTLDLNRALESKRSRVFTMIIISVIVVGSFVMMGAAMWGNARNSKDAVGKEIGRNEHASQGSGSE